MNLHYQLETLMKCISTIANYYHKLTNLANSTLATADNPLNDLKIISFLLAGFGMEYDPSITSVTTRVEQHQPIVNIVTTNTNISNKSTSSRSRRNGGSQSSFGSCG